MRVNGLLPSAKIKDLIGKPIKMGDKIIGKIIKAKAREDGYILYEGIIEDKYFKEKIAEGRIKSTSISEKSLKCKWNLSKPKAKDEI